MGRVKPVKLDLRSKTCKNVKKKVINSTQSKKEKKKSKTWLSHFRIHVADQDPKSNIHQATDQKMLLIDHHSNIEAPLQGTSF